MPSRTIFVNSQYAFLHGGGRIDNIKKALNPAENEESNYIFQKRVWKNI